VAAYREMIQHRNTAVRHGRVFLQGAETATCAYDHTGGDYERQVTLDTGYTLPSWAEDAYIRIGTDVCAIESAKTTTIATLDAQLNPGADVATGTSCTIYPAYYVLPWDFGSFEGPWSEDSWDPGSYVSPSEWMALDRYRDTTGTPDWYTVMPLPDLYGSMGLFVHPPADADETFDFMYRRKLRQLRYSGHNTAETAGTITIAGDASAVTGSGTSFDSKMVGSILRVGDASNVPTGLDGMYPFEEERSITAVNSTTSLTLDAAINSGSGYAGVKYVISDPIDLEEEYWNAFLRCCEKHLAIVRNMDSLGEKKAAFDEAMFLAKCASNRDTSVRVAGSYERFGRRLADIPLGDDEE